MGKVIILVGSMRKNGNTEMLAEAFAAGAKENNEVEIISVSDYKVKPCIGCNTCFEREDNSCFQKDDMVEVYKKLADADAIVIASPVYFYGISAQLKAIIDRLHTPFRNTFKVKKLGLLLVAGATLPEVFDSVKIQYQLVLDYFKLEDLGSVLVGDVRHKGDIEGNQGLIDAFNLGKNLNGF